MITDEQFENIINKLDKEYLNDCTKWLIVTTVCKCHNKFDIWNTCCQKSDKYNKHSNMIMWKNNKGYVCLYSL